MKKIAKATYETASQVDARVKLLEERAALLPTGTVRQSVLIQIAQLRAYADVKRWLAEPQNAAELKRHKRLKVRLQPFDR